MVDALEPETAKPILTLHNSNEHLRTLVERAADAIFVSSLDGRLLIVNQQACQNLGYSSEELHQMSIHDVDDIYQTPEEVSAVLGRLERDKAAQFESRHRRKNGSTFPVELRVSLLEIDDTAVVVGFVRDITERQQAQEALRTLAAKWQATFDAVQNSVCILDTDWNIVQANQATATVLNIPLKSIIGRKCYELLHGTLEPIESCPLRRLNSKSQRETEELKLGDRWVEVAADPIVNAAGQLEGFVHIITDIDERKQAEEALKQNESTLQSIFKAAPTGIGMVRNRMITQVNERLCEMIGYAPEELVNQNARILYPTDADYEYVGQEKYAQISARGTGTVETRWQHKNGEIIDVLLSSTPLNIDNWSAGVTFTALDITERKKTENALRASHEMFLTVLDGIDATIYVADMTTYEVLFMNKYMQESFGQDFTGQICWQAFRGEDKPCEHCSNDKLLDAQGKPAGVYVWQDRNPITKKWYVNYDRAIEWIDGRVVRIQIATDISELKRLESQLLQSQKLEAIGNLAGGIAHDFNNILSAVIGYAELSLADVDHGSAVEKNLREILRAGVRARDLVKHILTFARRSDDELKPVKVSTVAIEVLKLLRSTLPTSIAISAQINSDSLAMADPTQIHQIFMNLCTNAAHAMEAKGGTLTVSLSDVTFTGRDHDSALARIPGPYLKLMIADTGVGIPEAHLDSIFEPYFTTKSQGEGTGLGLSVVHGIVKGYDGEILVESNEGQGTVFTIFLPITGGTSADAPPLSLRLAQGHERVLFVDDELPICELGAQVLTRLGYEVTARTSSVEALALFRAKPDEFDIVVTDMTMPNLTGDKLAAALIQTRPNIPIVLCTGYSRVMSEEKAAAIGIKAFAMKPLTIEDLSKTLRKVLDQAQTPHA